MIPVSSIIMLAVVILLSIHPPGWEKVKALDNEAKVINVVLNR
jgi:hypothetical protein